MFITRLLQASATSDHQLQKVPGGSARPKNLEPSTQFPVSVDCGRRTPGDSLYHLKHYSCGLPVFLGEVSLVNTREEFCQTCLPQSQGPPAVLTPQTLTGGTLHSIRARFAKTCVQNIFEHDVDLVNWWLGRQKK